MKAALIAPIAELKSFEHRDGIHLVLSHLLSNPTYLNFYQKRWKLGDYLILDNSAHEFRKPVTPLKLLADAVAIKADEIVLPDVPYDREATLKLAGAALDKWAKYGHGVMLELKPHMMLVPQGSTLEEWRTCLFGLVLRWHRFSREWPELSEYVTMPTIGLPAKYEKTFGQGTVRMLLEKWLKPKSEEGYSIHLLGCRELWGLNDLALEFPWIRSVDSAKPVVYGMKGIVWDPRHEPEPAHVDRPANFFDVTLTPHQREVAKFNEMIFGELARGRYKERVKA